MPRGKLVGDVPVELLGRALRVLQLLREQRGVRYAKPTPWVVAVGHRLPETRTAVRAVQFNYRWASMLLLHWVILHPLSQNYWTTNY